MHAAITLREQGGMREKSEMAVLRETNKDQFLEQIRRSYQEMTAQNANGEDVRVWNGIKYSVREGVYAPNIFTDSFWFASEVQRVVGSGSFLEVGCGSGLIGIYCAKKGANVLMLDIDQKAVATTRENCLLNAIEVDVVQSDIFNQLKNDKLFDFIFWSHPFNSENPDGIDGLVHTGFDPGYAALSRYAREGKKWLRPGGALLLGTGDSANVELMKSVFREAGVNFMIRAEDVLPFSTACHFNVRYQLAQLQ